MAINTNMMIADGGHNTIKPKINNIIKKSNTSNNNNNISSNVSNTVKNTTSNDSQQYQTNNGLDSTQTASGTLGDRLADYLNRMREQAKASYESNKNNITSMYNNSLSSAQNAYNSGMSALQQAYAQQQAKAKAEKEAADRESYINKMLQQKNLEQNLAAQGISGGASESTQAKLANNYMNSRNAIYKDYSDNISDLDIQYQTNVANAQSQYQNVLQALEQMRAQYDMQNETQYQNNLANYTENYANIGANYDVQLDLQKEINALNRYEFDRELAANNEYRLAQLKQKTENVSKRNNVSYEDMITIAKENGAKTDSEILAFIKKYSE